MQDLHQETRHSASGTLVKLRARPLVVVIRLSALGDVLLTASTLQKLGATHDVMLVTEPAYAPLAARLPGVTQVHPLARREGLAGALRLGRELRRLQPDLVLDFQSKVRSQAAARLMGAPLRTLHRRSWGQVLRAAIGNDTVLDNQHQTQRYEAFLPTSASQPPTSPRIELAPEWVEEAERLVSGAKWGERPAVAVAPAATHATKGWGARRYAKVVKAVAAPGSPLLLVGGPSDAADLGDFLEELGDWPALIDTRALPLTTLAALLASCRLLVGNDSGPIHLATLLGVPTLALFGPTSSRRWGPLAGQEQSHRALTLALPCSPCSNHGGKRCPLGHHHCMIQLSEERVIQEVGALMAASAT